MSGKQDNNNESTQAQPPLMSKTTSRLIWSVQDINALFNINIQQKFWVKKSDAWYRVVPEYVLLQITEKLVRFNTKLPSFW